MGHHDNNHDAQRDERLKQEEHRQEVRDEVFDETGGKADDLGSQDERRKQGDNSH